MGLQEEITNNKQEIFTDSYPMSIGELVGLYKDEEIDIHPEFQRIFRWDDKQRTKLIESILLGIPIPSIFVNQRDDGVWDVIDGVQRLSTIFQFLGILKNEKGENVAPLKLLETEYLPSLKNKVWNDEDNPENSLTKAQQLDFKREKLFIQIVKKESDPKTKYDLFQRLNTLGSKLSDQEIRNCLLVMINPNFYRWLVEISSIKSFIDCISISDNQGSRGYDVELVLRFLVFKNSTDEELRKDFNIGDFITEKMKNIAQNPNFNFEEEKRVFEDTFNLLNEISDENIFRRYDDSKNRFLGKFLVSAFESIAVGIGSNINHWNSDNNKNILVEKIKSMWQVQSFRDNIGAGIGAYQRISKIIPFGKNHFQS